MKLTINCLIVCAAVFAADAIGAVRYVDVNNGSPTPPYFTWATAAQVIQDAVDVSAAGDEIVVTNGSYVTGGRAVFGTMTNRVAVDKPVFIRSVNGADFASIIGHQVPGTTNGDGAIRCVYLTNGASLSGFTLTNGATRTAGDFMREASGGAAWCESFQATVSNCILVANSAASGGGGAYSGTLNDCALTGNSAYAGGGAYYANLNRCLVQGNWAQSGGGVADDYNGVGVTLNHCILNKNSASEEGGGALYCALSDCLLTANSASAGGGLFGGSATACTIVGNSASDSGGGASGAVLINNWLICRLDNSILYFNTPDNYANNNSFLCEFHESCTTPLPAGSGNINNDPLLIDAVAGNLRLQSNSPCINAGNDFNVLNAQDLDGNPRIINGTVDMGAYEYQGNSGLTGFHAWLASYGLPSDGSADYADSDGDGMNNYQEWRAGTQPTYAPSVLRMFPAVPLGTNTLLRWRSVLGVGYYVQRSASLSSPVAFTTIGTNIAGQGGTTIFTDTNGSAGATRFYRVGTQ